MSLLSKMITGVFGKKSDKDLKVLSPFVDKINEYYETLSSFNVDFIERCCKYLEIKTKLILSSTLNIPGEKTEKLVNICKSFSTDSYLSTIGTKEKYLKNEEHKFENVGIEVIYHDYTHPVYSQRGKKFLDHLSILDLILNMGSESKNFFKD